MSEREQDNLDHMARLIAIYESDRPRHGEWEEGSAWPDFTEEDLREWRQDEHRGDCTNEPFTCMRCFAEMCYHYAAWLLAQFPAALTPPEDKDRGYAGKSHIERIKQIIQDSDLSDLGKVVLCGHLDRLCMTLPEEPKDPEPSTDEED